MKNLVKISDIKMYQIVRLIQIGGIGEFIFGTTITRGIKSLFDIRMYEPCPDGYKSWEDLPQLAKDIIYVVAPIITFGVINKATLEGTVGKVCFNIEKCPDNYVKLLGGNFCYLKCNDPQAIPAGDFKNGRVYDGVGPYVGKIVIQVQKQHLKGA